MKSHVISCLILTLITTWSVANDRFEGKVISVIDGNTIDIVNAQKDTVRLMLADIDSPEINQEFGEDAKRFVEKMAMKKEVVVELTGKDRKGNHLGILLIKGRIDLRVELLKEGLAWTSEKNPSPELEQIRVSAEQNKVGLWKVTNPTPPWTYRRQQSMMQIKSS